MNRTTKIELIQRSLGLRHKIKVHESMQTPNSHEDLAIFLLAKWDLEDELRAVEEILADIRSESAHDKRKLIEENILNDKPIKSKPAKKLAKSSNKKR